MFQGFGFAILAAALTILTLIGVLFAALAWFFVLADETRVGVVVIPSGLYPLTFSVASGLAAWMICVHLPFEIARSLLGGRVERIVLGSFSLLSFALSLIARFRVRGQPGTEWPIRTGSTLLVILWLLGFGSYIFGS